MSDALDITLPYNDWWPRDHQMKLWEYLQFGGKRAMAVWHRRAGKDEVCLHFAAVAAMRRVGNYWHCLPEFSMGRKAIWDSINPHSGQRRIDEAFPHQIRASTRDHDMLIKFVNGSTWQVIGSDSVTSGSGIGSSTAGIVFSEYALANPAAWAYYRPILEENDGWAAFITTPRGRNHAHELFRYSARAPGWFSERLTARDTGSLSEPALAEALSEYQALYGNDQGEAQFRQEYLCDWTSALLGSFYAAEMTAVREENRILEIEPIADKPVNRAWDLGIGDDTSIWWWQQSGAQILLLDHLAASGVGVEWYRDEIFKRHDERGWIHGTDYVPHDAKVREFGTGRTRVETMQGLGLKPSLVPLATLDDGINAVRRTLPLCVFHPRTEHTGIAALEQYRREWDEEKKCFKPSAVHDWCFTGDTKVLTRYGAQRLDDLSQTGEVLTPCGWKRYYSPRITRRDAQLVEVRFEDGLTVRCTPDHMFMTASGWKSAEFLTSTTQIQSCLTLSRSISMAAFTAYFQVKHTIRVVAKSCTAKLGSLLSALFPMVATFTTATVTCETTILPISNVFQVPSIDRKRGRDGNERAIKAFWGHRQQRWKRPPIGIARRQASFGTSAMPSGKKAGSSGSVSRWPVRFAVKSLKRLFERAEILKSIAAQIAGSRGRVVTSVKPLNERADVWCMTVPDGECFALANGAITHNCSHPADSFRYLSQAWRPVARIVPRVVRPSGWLIPPPPPTPRRGGIVL